MAASELPVLPECEYQSVMAYPHEMKKYWGHKEVYVCVHTLIMFVA